MNAAWSQKQGRDARALSKNSTSVIDRESIGVPLGFFAINKMPKTQSSDRFNELSRTSVGFVEIRRFRHG
jgi:hypothetical protein